MTLMMGSHDPYGHYKGVSKRLSVPNDRDTSPMVDSGQGQIGLSVPYDGDISPMVDSGEGQLGLSVPNVGDTSHMVDSDRVN